MKIKYLLRFSKTGLMKFIGHLDLLRLTQRCIKRSGIPIDYSKGFNPHQLVSFALPLPIGMEGFSEYMEIEMQAEFAPKEIMDKMNQYLPEGMKVIACRKMADGEKGPASVLRAAEFNVKLQGGKELASFAAGIMESKSLVVPVQGKNDTKETEIRSDIYKLEVTDTELNMIISQGSQRNLKPEVVVKYLYEQMGIEYISHKIFYKRLELFKFSESGNLEPILYMSN